MNTHVDYAYATSTTASKFGFKNSGCYLVSIDGNAEFAFATLSAAHEKVWSINHAQPIRDSNLLSTTFYDGTLY